MCPHLPGLATQAAQPVIQATTGNSQPHLAPEIQMREKLLFVYSCILQEELLPLALSQVWRPCKQQTPET